MGIFDELNEIYAKGGDFSQSGLNADEALALLGRLFSREALYKNNFLKRYSKLSRYLKEWLPEILSTSELREEKTKEVFKRLPYLTGTILENFRLPMLSGKTVVGVGGPFSAGKSSFLNSLTGLDQLPEGQGYTTAIGTYLIYGDTLSIKAHTKCGNIEELTPQELKAVTHDFYDTYKIGFADVLYKLIITSPNLSEGIILLDTPGYNKPKGAQEEIEAADARIAREHLSNCDYLIWLMETASGTITESDINFLRSLSLENQCLIIFNKADMKTDDDIRKVVGTTEHLIRSSEIPCFGVTAYSSREGKEYLGQDLLKKYMNIVSNHKAFSALNEIEIIKKVWIDDFDQRSKNVVEKMTVVQDAIMSSCNVEHIQSLLDYYVALQNESSNLYWKKKIFLSDMTKLIDNIRECVNKEYV